MDRDSDVDRRFVGPIWLRLLGVVLSLTTLLRTGLVSRLLMGDEGFDDLVSCACALPDLRDLLSSVADVVDAARLLARRRVRGGDGARSGWAEPPSLRSALVRALSFIGTGISSSELSCMAYCCESAFLDRAGAAAVA